MPKPWARRATALPISPPPPISPMVLPQTNEPSRWRDCPPGNLPARTRRSPSHHAARHREHQPESEVGGRLGGDRRHHGDRDARARSPRRRRCWTARSIAPRCGAASDWPRSRRGRSGRAAGKTGCRHCFTAAISVVFGMMRLSSGKTLTLPNARRRLMRAFGDRLGHEDARLGGSSRSTARRRRRRRPRPARRREWSRWRRARRAPSGCRARARARRDARSSRRARPPRRRPAAGCGSAPAPRPWSPACRPARPATARIRSSPPRRGRRPSRCRRDGR